MLQTPVAKQLPEVSIADTFGQHQKHNEDRKECSCRPHAELDGSSTPEDISEDNEVTDHTEECDDPISVGG